VRIGLAYDLKAEQSARSGGPDDLLEEYDSEDTVAALAGALRELGHAPLALGGGRQLVERLLASPPELVFTISEGAGTRSREAHVPAVCEMLGVPCTHSDPLTLAATLDKAVAKKLVAADGVPTPRFALVARAEDARTVDLPLPLIVKPLQEGSSMGVRRSSRVTDRAALAREVARVLEGYAQPALVEEFCPGTELTVGVLGTGAAARVIGCMEIAPRRARPEEFVYSVEVKRDWEQEVEYHVPPRLPADALRAAERTALSAYQALGCRDVARIDLRLDVQGVPRFLEANPLPGMNPRTGDLPILARKCGLPYGELVGAIVRAACERHGIG
jgi:D-alanine-D-alanine ligase